MPKPVFHDELVITLLHRNWGTVLISHDLAANRLFRALFGVVNTIVGVEEAFLGRSLVSFFLGLDFALNLALHLLLQKVLFAAYTRKILRGVFRSTPTRRSRSEACFSSLAVDSCICVVGFLLIYDRVLEVKVLFWDVVASNRSKTIQNML